MEIEDKYLSSANCKDNDIIIILDAGTKETIENKFKPGQKKDIYNFTIEKDGKQFIFSPNNTTLKQFVMAWGKSTEKWIGHKFQVKLALMTSGKSAIMANLID